MKRTGIQCGCMARTRCGAFIPRPWTANESETLAEVRLRVNDAPEVEVSIPAPPSLTIWRFQVKGTEWRLEDRYFDTTGNMLP